MEFSSGDIVYFKTWATGQTDLKIELVKPREDDCWIVRCVDKTLTYGEYKGMNLADFDSNNQTFICHEELFGDPVYPISAVPIDVSDYL